MALARPPGAELRPPVRKVGGPNWLSRGNARPPSRRDFHALRRPKAMGSLTGAGDRVRPASHEVSAIEVCPSTVDPSSSLHLRQQGSTGTIEHPRLIRRIHDIRSFDLIVNAEPLGDLVPGEDARRGSAG